MMNQENPGRPSVDALLEQFSQVKVPPDILRRLEAKVQEFPSGESVLVPSRPTRVQKLWRYLPRLSLAAGLAGLMIGAWILTVGNSNAWAQVTKTIQSKPWVRFTLQLPKEGLVPDGIQAPQIWFSAKNRIGACRGQDSALFINFAARESFVYESKTKTIVQSGIAVFDNMEFENYETLLKLLNEDNQEWKTPESGIQILKRTRREIVEGTRTWVEFTFSCRNPRLASMDYQITFRVDPETHLPREMRTTRKLSPKDPDIQLTLLMDYPATGPTGIYDLGVPKDALVMKPPMTKTEHGEEIRKFLDEYNQARGKSIEPFSVTVFESTPEMGSGDFYSAMKGRSDGNKVVVERIDPEPFWKIRSDLRSGKITIPKEVSPEKWWKDKFAGMPFSPMERGEELLPPRVGYPDITFGKSPIDNPDCQVTLDRNPKTGPAGTVLLKIRVETQIGFNDKYYWIDPARDYLVMRMEMHFSRDHAPWNNSTQVIDQLKKSPGGRWYPTRFLNGRIEKPGDNLPEKTVKVDPSRPVKAGEMGPVTTSVFRYFVQFD